MLTMDARMRRPLDVAVVGGGPVGSLCALAFARRGASVALLEARPDQTRRLGGEWIHPAGVATLRRLGVEFGAPTSFPTGNGFAVFPSGGGEPILLAYRAGERAQSCEHAEIVRQLRNAATRMPGVQYLPGARMLKIEGRRLTYRAATGGTRDIMAGLIVGADGRSSIVRKCLGYPSAIKAVSCMAGVLIEDAELPFEGYGHVLLGAPGPVLIYRIGPRRLRACLDIPLKPAGTQHRLAYLQRHYMRVLPMPMRAAFAEAIERGSVVWATNHVRRRTGYGRGRIVLVGDAVGCTHPLTATGMTLGFQDGECLSAVGQLAGYQRKRYGRCRVPQRLANSLYAAFARGDAETDAIRQAIFRIWRSQPWERQRTMELLGATNTSVWEFNRVFAKVATNSVVPLIGDLVRSKGWRRPATAFERIRRQLFWHDGHLLPRD